MSYEISKINAKQDTLVSGTNIKTINGTSVLGSGDLVVTGGGGISAVAVVGANGITGASVNTLGVANLTLALGAITPTSTNGVVISGSSTPTLAVTGTTSVSGTNTGDQTSIVGITGTKAQFDTAVTDGNILFVGDVTQYTDELAQDAVGAMVANSTFVNLAYVDATPSLTPSLSATGTPSATTFLRGDNTWATPASVDPAGWTTIVKSANQDVTNSATLVDDTSLQFSVVAGGHYMIEMDLCWSANNTTGDYAGRFIVSSGTMKGQGIGAGFAAAAGASATITFQVFNASNTGTFTSGTLQSDIDLLSSMKIIFSFTASSNATFIYQFANSVAAAGRISRTWKGSILKYKRLD